MRNAQKQEVLECIDSLHKANEEIREAIKRNDIIPAQTMLGQCQDFAVSLGENIEKLEGEGHVTVSFLEEYCEALYRVHGELDAGMTNADKLHKILRRQLLRVESSAKHDIHARREVVFLPYKASMWDSLESVWRAAAEDEDTDAYVIPIPYYDKNPDGSFGELHYEAGEYPKNVPVVWYENYDFEKRRPDMIFIHNPYDECNYVTSVLPFFYSSNLKKFTERLVYIPYFVLEEIEPEDPQALEQLKKFCLVPALFYADRVIVQSEKMRQAYIAVLTEATAGQKGLERAYWEQKILGLGSPKVDKVLETKKDGLEIPEEWMQVIRKPDGSWKKVVFYNVGVTALVEHGEKLIEKIEYVFKLFREQKDTIALLWRPHPLIRATMESMYPLLWFRYDRLVRKYCEEGWGIYDDTANVDRAVVLSNAYYGDGSSITQLFQSAGKPAMVQSINCVPFDWNGLFFSYKMAEHKGNVWIVAALFNGLFLLNIENGELEWQGKIPKEKDEIDNLFRDYLIVENKMYLAPANAENIVIYDIEKKQYQSVALDIPKCGKNGNYASVVQNGREIIFVGVCRTNIICKYSMDTGKISYIKPKEMTDIKIGVDEGVYGFKSCIRQDILYVPLLWGGCALKVNLKSEKTELLQLAEQKNTTFNLAIYIPERDSIWFVSHGGYIVQWNEKNQKKEVISFGACGEPVSEEYISYKLKRNKLYLFPRKCGMKYRVINICTGECVETLPSSFRVLDIIEIQGKDYYLGSKSDGQSYVVCVNEDGMKEEVVIHRKDGRKGKECFDEYQIEFFKDKEPLYFEGTQFQYGRSIEVYLNWLIDDGGFFDIEKADGSVNVGKKIWKNLQ